MCLSLPMECQRIGSMTIFGLDDGANAEILSVLQHWFRDDFNYRAAWSSEYGRLSFKFSYFGHGESGLCAGEGKTWFLGSFMSICYARWVSIWWIRDGTPLSESIFRSVYVTLGPSTPLFFQLVNLIPDLIVYSTSRSCRLLQYTFLIAFIFNTCSLLFIQ